jgi:hypothetical protein
VGADGHDPKNDTALSHSSLMHFRTRSNAKGVYLYQYSSTTNASNRHHPYTPPIIACQAPPPLHPSCQLSEWHRTRSSMTGTIETTCHVREDTEPRRRKAVCVPAVNGVNMIRWLRSSRTRVLSASCLPKCREFLCA